MTEVLPFPEAAEQVAALRAQVVRIVIGQDAAVDDLLATFLAGGHALLEGVPGLGKTLLVLALARAVGGRFARVQFTPDLMPTDVTGHAMLDPETRQFRVRRGPVFANLLLADEINRAPAKTQAALLEVMQEQQVTIEGQAHALEPPFFCLATQNPIEQEGTYPLPEAQLDRFLMMIRMDYPDAAAEARIVREVTLGRVGHSLDVEAVEQVVDPMGAVRLQHAAASVTVDDRVVDYAVRLVRATRGRPGISIGAGTRGAIALVRTGRARALMEGRDFVTPDDIKGSAPGALRHRIVLAPELQVEGLSADDALAGVLAAVEAPRR